MESIIFDREAQPTAIALYWHPDTEMWYLLGVYRDVEEGQESCRLWHGKGMEHIRLYSLGELVDWKGEPSDAILDSSSEAATP